MSIINPKWYNTITSSPTTLISSSLYNNISSTIAMQSSAFAFSAEDDNLKVKLVVEKKDQLKMLEAFFKFFSENGVDHVIEYYEKDVLVDKVER